jgi:hypothetical protein
MRLVHEHVVRRLTHVVARLTCRGEVLPSLRFWAIVIIVL